MTRETHHVCWHATARHANDKTYVYDKLMYIFNIYNETTGLKNFITSYNIYAKKARNMKPFYPAISEDVNYISW